MANTIDLSFVKQFEEEVHQVYQQMGAKMRGTVRTKTGIVGKSTTFQKIGKGSTSTKAQGPNLITPMEVPHTPIEVTLVDAYAGEWVDELDELKIQHDERRAVVTAAAGALGRETDSQIIVAAEATTTVVPTTAGGMTLPKVHEAQELLGNADAFAMGRSYCWVGWKQWTELLGIADFKSSDFVGPDDLPFRQSGEQGKFWLGTFWFPHTGLTLTPGAPDSRNCLWWNEFAIAHAIGKEITTTISWENPYGSHFINNRMSMGAALLDATGVVSIPCDEP